MALIRQEDIVNAAITVSALGTYKINNGDLEGSVTATVYALGYGVGGTNPLQQKLSGNTSLTGWADEQDLTLTNVSITTDLGAIVNGTIVGIYGAGAWTLGSGNLNIPRGRGYGAGSANSVIAPAGFNTVSLGIISTNEIFNGTVWTIGSNMPVGLVFYGIAGTKNATAFFGGSTALGSNNAGTTTVTQLYNGSSWASSGNSSFSRITSNGLGAQNSILNINGTTTSVGVTLSVAEFFNGTIWSITSPTARPRTAALGVGSMQAALAMAGLSAGFVTVNDLFNGSTWLSQGGARNTNTYQSTGGGTQNAAWITAGWDTNNNAVSTTELFNGTSWSLSGGTAVTSAQGWNYEIGCGAVALGVHSGTGINNNQTEFHNQTLYRAMDAPNLRTANNIGIATGVSGSTANVKLYGIAYNLSISGALGSYLVVTNKSNSTTAFSYQKITPTPAAEDWVVGMFAAITTTLQVFDSSYFALDEVKKWG